MIQTILGREDFRKSMDLYFDRHDGEATTIDAFLKCFEDAAGTDLAHYKLWYAQAGTPELVCSISHVADKQTAELTIEQVLPGTPGEPRKKPLHIPVKVALLGANGQEIALTLDTGEELADGVIHVTKRKETFRFTGVASPPVPSLLRGFSAPVNLTIDLSDRDLEFLMANDGDLFNRWQAANTYATRCLKQIVTALAAGKRSSRGLSYAKALGATIGDTSLDHAYRAELLKLPSQSDIAREIGHDIDPSVIYRAHRQLLRLVGTVLGDTLEEIYVATTVKGPFSPDPKSAGRRALRNVALGLLTARREDRDLARLSEHFFKAGNMTDEAHALFLIAAENVPDRDRALQHFYKRWNGDHLVIDTWFAAQALSPLATTLPDLESLTAHPLFALTAPNKVRALIGTFALHNPVQFNRPDGAGYAFVAERVLAIDKFNPQIAARILSSFRSWRSLETGRRAQARRSLQKVAKADGLSRDAFEIVSKMLDD